MSRPTPATPTRPASGPRRSASALLLGVLTLALVALPGCDMTIDAIDGYSLSESTGSGGGGADPPPAEQARIRINNEGLSPVVAVYIARCSASSWGSNRLSGTIPPYTAQTFGPFTPGCYDLRADTQHGHQFTLTGRQIEPGLYTATIR